MLWRGDFLEAGASDLYLVLKAGDRNVGLFELVANLVQCRLSFFEIYCCSGDGCVLLDLATQLGQHFLDLLGEILRGLTFSDRFLPGPKLRGVTGQIFCLMRLTISLRDRPSWKSFRNFGSDLAPRQLQEGVAVCC